MKRNSLITSILSTLLIINSCTHRDVNNGIQEEYYPNGEIKSVITLKNGLREGKAKYFDTQGRLISESNYKNELKEGELINYDPESRLIIVKANFRNGLQDGEVIQNYREGMLFRKSNYTKGLIDGLVTNYWPNGKIKAKNEFHNGKPAIGLKEYDKNEKLIIQPTLVLQKSSWRISTLDLSINGEFKEVEFYIGDLEDGKYFNPKNKKLTSDYGKAYYEYSALKKTYRMTKFNVLAKVKTKYGNTLILSKSFNI